MPLSSLLVIAFRRYHASTAIPDVFGTYPLIVMLSVLSIKLSLFITSKSYFQHIECDISCLVVLDCILLFILSGSFPRGGRSILRPRNMRAYPSSFLFLSLFFIHSSCLTQKKLCNILWEYHIICTKWVLLCKMMSTYINMRSVHIVQLQDFVYFEVHEEPRTIAYDKMTCQLNIKAVWIKDFRA